MFILLIDIVKKEIRCTNLENKLFKPCGNIR